MNLKHMHTVIEDPLQLRKQLLESALCSAEALKNVEMMKTMSDDMIVFRKQLKMMAKTLRASVGKFQQCLPDLPPEFKEQQREEQPVVEGREPVQERPMLLLDDQDTFKKDLESLRDRIRSLER